MGKHRSIIDQLAEPLVTARADAEAAAVRDALDAVHPHMIGRLQEDTWDARLMVNLATMIVGDVLTVLSRSPQDAWFRLLGWDDFLSRCES